MKMSTRMFFVALVMPLVLVAFALPAAAHGFGPVLYCDAGTLSNCTDTIDVASAQDTFGCEGEAGDAASCTNRRTGEASPYCVFQGHVSGTERDSYLCGPALGEQQQQPGEHSH
jgi:hypothetical protein